MTYYEELCIPSSATPDEIHLAHRRLIKILHPDLQIDEIARRLAEVQTRRINGIADILLDPAARKEYEASLVISPPRLHRDKQRSSLANLAITGLFVLAGLWLLESDRASLPQQPVVPTPAADHRPTPPGHGTERRSESTVDSRSRLPSPPSQQPTLEASGRTASGVLAAKLPEPFVPTHEPSRPEPADRTAIPTDKPADEQSPQPLEHHTPPSLAEETNPFIGTWIYVPPPVTDENRKLYRPEYIEMRIHDAQGVLEGQYRARYHVPDRPLSPNVGFHFAGQSRGSSAAFQWNGSNGLAGRVELKMTSTNSIQVDWRVTELAESADLVSGTAILTRVQ